MASRWQRWSRLGVVVLAACGDADNRTADSRATASVPDASVDVQSCMDADAYFGLEIARSASGTRRACSRDEDCTLWSPVLSCPPSLQVLNCALAVRSDALPALELERTRVTSETCPMFDEVCSGIGVSCVPSRAVCTQSVCTTTTSLAPADVPCSVDATSNELGGARIHIEADDCHFRAGEGGKFRYRVELPSTLAYQTTASTSCGSCAQDRTDASQLVVARVGTGETHYCPTCDVGCCGPDRAAEWTLHAKTFEAVLDWPGRSWNGPSDTSAPLGSTFAPGSYQVDVTLAVPGVGKLTALLPIVVE
jgi:hypothetical protein